MSAVCGRYLAVGRGTLRDMGRCLQSTFIKVLSAENPLNEELPPGHIVSVLLRRSLALDLVWYIYPFWFIGHLGSIIDYRNVACQRDENTG